jgi:hypothetical protein
MGEQLLGGGGLSLAVVLQKRAASCLYRQSLCHTFDVHVLCH